MSNSGKKRGRFANELASVERLLDDVIHFSEVSEAKQRDALAMIQKYKAKRERIGKAVDAFRGRDSYFNFRLKQIDEGLALIDESLKGMEKELQAAAQKAKQTAKARQDATTATEGLHKAPVVNPQKVLEQRRRGLPEVDVDRAHTKHLEAQESHLKANTFSSMMVAHSETWQAIRANIASFRGQLRQREVDGNPLAKILTLDDTQFLAAVVSGEVGLGDELGFLALQRLREIAATNPGLRTEALQHIKFAMLPESQNPERFFKCDTDEFEHEISKLELHADRRDAEMKACEDEIAAHDVKMAREMPALEALVEQNESEIERLQELIALYSSDKTISRDVTTTTGTRQEVLSASEREAQLSHFQEKLESLLEENDALDLEMQELTDDYANLLEQRETLKQNKVIWLGTARAVYAEIDHAKQTGQQGHYLNCDDGQWTWALNRAWLQRALERGYEFQLVEQHFPEMEAALLSGDIHRYVTELAREIRSPDSEDELANASNPKVLHRPAINKASESQYTGKDSPTATCLEILALMDMGCVAKKNPETGRLSMYHPRALKSEHDVKYSDAYNRQRDLRGEYRYGWRTHSAPITRAGAVPHLGKAEAHLGKPKASEELRQEYNEDAPSGPGNSAKK